jgi:hypothetical protein
MEVARAAGLMPNLDRIIVKGENRRGLSAMSSYQSQQFVDRHWRPPLCMASAAIISSIRRPAPRP